MRLDPRHWLRKLKPDRPGPLRRLLSGAGAAVGRVLARGGGRVRRRALIARMQPADVVLASPRTPRLSLIALLYRFLLGSRYVHSMLHLGDGRMIHTTARHGVTIGPLPGKLFDRERYAVYRVPGLSRTHQQQVVEEARALLDHGLDHAGLVTNIPARWLGLPRPLVRREEGRLWCGKLIHTAYARAGIDLLPEQESGTVTSQDLASSPLLEEVRGGPG